MQRPISIVTKDQDALRALISIHAPRWATNRILDTTYNTGKMWKGIPLYPNKGWTEADNILTTMDIDPQYMTDIVWDYTKLDELVLHDVVDNTGGKFDVIVWDPPHMAHAKNSIHVEQYGVDVKLVADMWRFLQGAESLLAPGGIILAKIADQTHGGKYVWHHRDFLNAAELKGYTACDMMIKVRKSPIIDPKWKNVYHVRKAHSYWICLRKGKKCQRSPK